jgi:aminocarboxymuconate-semialdehyde decarboxylase
MLIDLHAHHITPGMVNRHDHWGPRITAKGIKIGHWVLGAKNNRLAAENDETAERKLLERFALKRRLEMMEEKGVDKLVVSVPAHFYMYWAGEFGNQYARVVNDELAAMCAQASGRIHFWGHANLADPSNAAKEIERAVTELGAKGMSMGGANFGGLEVHDEALYPVWEKLCELRVPIFVHGYNQSVTWGEKWTEDRYDTTSIIGMCNDEARLFWYMINAGVLDVFPDLKVYITHGGGFVPYQVRRFHETNLTMAPDSKNKKPVLEYMQNFYFDLDLHSPAMRRAVVEDIGVDRLLYGTNFGGADSHSGDLTEGLGLSETDREKIRSGNTLKLMPF